MDKFCPIFPFHQHDEEDHHQLDFQNTISTFQFQQPHIIEENLVTNHALVGSSDVDSFLNYNIVGHAGGEFHQPSFVDINLGNNKRQHRSSSSASGNVGFDHNDNKQKKIIHKETERQRRSEMANLYASLKSLLPPESTKGRQSTSDFIHEAENHIRIKQKNIADLKVQRDNLKKWTKSTDENNNLNSSIDETSLSLPCSYCPVDISVTSYLGGMEILICIDLRMDGFQLSRALEHLLAEGLCVVSCVCTRINGKILHIIQTEIKICICHRVIQRRWVVEVWKMTSLLGVKFGLWEIKVKMLLNRERLWTPVLKPAANPLTDNIEALVYKCTLRRFHCCKMILLRRVLK